MDRVLSSWKEIAQYLGKSVRTVQRWEEQLGLPLRRPVSKERGIVFALTTEIDEWLLNQSHSQPAIANALRKNGGAAQGNGHTGASHVPALKTLVENFHIMEQRREALQQNFNRFATNISLTLRSVERTVERSQNRNAKAKIKPTLKPLQNASGQASLGAANIG